MEAESSTLSFAKDIRPMFSDLDVEHMKPFGMDLSNRDDVMNNAAAIYADVSTGRMPPRSSGEEPWTVAMCERFKAWQSQGCPP